MNLGPRAAARLATEIAQRRDRDNDPDLALLAEGPYNMLGHVALHTRVSQATLTADVLAGFALARYLHHQIDRWELRLFAIAARCNLPLSAIATAAGFRSREAMYQHRRSLQARVARLDAAVTASDEAETAAARAAEPAAGDLRDVAGQLVVQLQSADLDEVADDRDRIGAALKAWPADGPCPPRLRRDLEALVGDLNGRSLTGRLAAATRRAADLLDLD